MRSKPILFVLILSSAVTRKQRWRYPSKDGAILQKLPILDNLLLDRNYQAMFSFGAGDVGQIWRKFEENLGEFGKIWAKSKSCIPKSI